MTVITFQAIVRALSSSIEWSLYSRPAVPSRTRQYLGPKYFFEVENAIRSGYVDWLDSNSCFLFRCQSLQLRPRISRYGETELILDESSSQLKTEQDALITGRLNKFRPVQMTTVWLLGAGTLFVVAYYIHDMINQFK